MKAQLVMSFAAGGENLGRAETQPRAMLDLRSLDPARQTADRRVALAIGYGAIGSMTFAAVAAGGGGRALALGVVAALAGLPWVFAFGGRWRLLDDAVAGVPFVWRGDRTGVWATAPVAGALLALALSVALVAAGLPRVPGVAGRRGRATRRRCGSPSSATSG